MIDRAPIVIASLALVTAAPAQTAGTKEPAFRLGVCCHPSYVRFMPVTWDEVFDWVKGCGATICRVDWAGDYAMNEATLEAAERAGVELLPVLFPPAPADDTEQAWYDSARAYAEECGRRYGDRVRYFELSNERDLVCMTKWPDGGDRDGASMGDYDPAKYAPIRGMLRGLAEGLRATDPDCLRVIDTGGWLHFAFVDLLVRDGVPFDVLAWHWYSEMGDMTQPVASYSGKYVVLNRLVGYGKPVWITEGDARDGTLGHTQEHQARYVLDTVASLRKTGKVGCYVVYELFDEPYLTWAGGEAHYGIVRCEWGLSEGAEFPGARGSIAIGELAGRTALRLGWDFTRGGRYVAVCWQPARPVEATSLRLTLRSGPGTLPLLVRFVDSTGQHLQLKPRVEVTGAWQTVDIPVAPPFTDHWAGANDGQVHPPLRGVWIGVEGTPQLTGELAIARAELTGDAGAAYAFDFAEDSVFEAKQAWRELRDNVRSTSQ